jgi:hypothetical protein
MQVNLHHLQQGLLNFDASDEIWDARVTEAFKNLKSELSISDDYLINIEPVNPFQSLMDQLNELITAFQGFLNEHWLQPLKLTIQEFKTLLDEILPVMDSLRVSVQALVDKIVHYATTNFGSLHFFDNLYKGDIDTVQSFFSEVTNSITRINILVVDFINRFRDRIISNVINTVHAISTIRIETPSYKIINNTEVDVVNQFN